jgi:hypothetical protein
MLTVQFYHYYNDVIYLRFFATFLVLGGAGLNKILIWSSFGNLVWRFVVVQGHTLARPAAR